MSKGLFITATGTDVGKTYVTALLVKKLVQAGLKAGYYKAALSGAEYRDGVLVPGDADYVQQVAQTGQSYAEMVSYIYENAVSPHLAAQLEGSPVELPRVQRDFAAVCQKYAYVTMEGSGGIACPIRYDAEQRLMLTDIILALHLPALVVADAGLGTLNAIVTTCAYMRSLDIPVAGVVLNNFEAGNRLHEDNRQMVEPLAQVPVIAVVSSGAADLDISVEQLCALYQKV